MKKEKKKKSNNKDLVKLLERHNRKFKNTIIFPHNIEIIVDEVCVDTGLQRTEVKKMIDSQFRMLKDVINSEGLVKEDSEFDKFKSIRLVRIGSFRPSEKKFEYIQKYLETREDEKK
jgi:hypothetical protein